VPAARVAAGKLATLRACWSVLGASHIGEPMTKPPAKPFAHLDAPNAELYRGVMGVFVAAWDPCLTEAMLGVGVKVEEERLLDDLLADLTGRVR
jgi:Protein of unknown function C-terminus (DUF2399)